MGRDASYFDSQVLSFKAIGGFPMEIKTKLTGILLKMGAYGAKGLTPINFKTMYYEVSLWYMNAFKKF